MVSDTYLKARQLEYKLCVDRANTYGWMLETPRRDRRRWLRQIVVALQAKTRQGRLNEGTDARPRFSGTA